jgi:mono/diheme cytochrome c family protein
MTPTSSRRVSSSNTERILVRALAAGAMIAALACAGTSFAEDAPDATKLWTKHCQSCHGADGKGKTKMGEKLGVRDLTAADVKASLTQAKAVEAIKNGVKDPDDPAKLVMKSYSEKMSAAEIDAVAAHSLAFK